MDAVTAITAAVAAVIGAVLGGGGIGAIMTGYFKHRLEAREQAHGHHVVLIERLELRISVLEAQNSECQKENAKIREELGGLREAVRRMEAEQHDGV